MRGEEVQLLGAGISDGTAVLPGTHSKWAHLEHGAICQFRTFMTGELFALLKTRLVADWASHHRRISSMSWTDVFAGVPLVAIPRGLTPEEAEPVGAVLIEAGFRCLQALKAMRAVLPASTHAFPVGGIDSASMTPWHAAGAAGFGIGGSLHSPGRQIADLCTRADELVRAWRDLPR